MGPSRRILSIIMLEIGVLIGHRVGTPHSWWWARLRWSKNVRSSWSSWELGLKLVDVHPKIMYNVAYSCQHGSFISAIRNHCSSHGNVVERGAATPCRLRYSADQIRRMFSRRIMILVWIEHGFAIMILVSPAGYPLLASHSAFSSAYSTSTFGRKM
jgi:hypothetical protein